MKSNIALLTLILTAPLALAQGKPSSNITTKVDLVSITENIQGLTLGKKNQPVTAFAFRYGQTVRYQGSRIIEISQSSTGASEPPADEEQHPHATVPLPKQKLPKTEIDQSDTIAKAIEKRRLKNPNLVALAVVPAGARHVTILLAPSTNNTYRTYVINDDPSKLPYGKMRVHNFCRHPINMRFNNGKPKLIPSLKGSQESPRKNNTLSYLLSYPKKNKWKIQERNVVPINKNEQVQMIILRSNASFFTSSTGARGGRLQVAVLRRNKALQQPQPGNPTAN